MDKNTNNIIIPLLLIIITMMGAYILYDKFGSSQTDINNNPINNTPTTDKNYNNSITNNGEYYYITPKEENTTNTRDVENTTPTNNNTNTINYNIDYSKKIPLNSLFMPDLNYFNTIDLTKGSQEGKIKQYKLNNVAINFDIRNYKPDLDNPEYISVQKTNMQFKYGDYIKYTYTTNYGNTTTSYCYVRKIGNYYMIMGFFEINKNTTDLWEKWNKYIFDIYY
ncbi:hypothetical protein [Methanococcus aeolicus]|uniref:Uncharacterized protein n=2 Tax=Methanococcus aeolicus TaxID=42879 RepID=A6UW66_META3|nr:hypothetical protein [Methanococcus aeolicus]ABR56738.1 hypothetical protein Maeo_1161 [Methanococcus aeolicus Nankai-3]UXM84738.1 hypothetical protein N6C89_00100 [Methanococcus aeolicus]